MRAKAARWLKHECRKEPHAQHCTHYGDRIEIRRLWAYSSDPESTGLYAASQVFVIEREVIPTGAINAIDTAIKWLTRKYNPLGR